LVGHFVRVVVYGDFSKVFTSLVSEFGNIFYYALFGRNGRRVGILLGEKMFFWRTGSDVGLFVLVEEVNDRECELIILSYAGGSGIWHISWGAHPRYVKDVLYFLRRSGYSYDVISEIDYFDSKKIPPDVRRRLGEVLESFF